jgi:hypothetical protein
MKKQILIICAAVACFAFAGCATVDKSLLTATVAPAATNAVSGAITPAVTNYAPNAAATVTAQAVSAMPFPFAGTAGIAAGWLLTAYAAWRNRKLASALVTGIDAGRQILQSTPEGQKLDAKFKDLLIQHQDAAGVLDAAASLVNKLTGDTVKPAA